VTAKTPSNWQARPSQERYIEIQQALAEKGFFKGEANGAWGADSVAALKDFQRSQNLEPDGKLGSLSLIALGMGPKRIVASAADTQGSALMQQSTATATVEGAGRQQ
jgi:peptidoglycan hydrolase-like protein with peptidoglycan-binding domain